MQDTYRYLVSGRVQGVGFRAATQSKGRELNLAGWARNLPDGQVEVLASGQADALNALRHWLNQGPPGARVDTVDEHHLDSTQDVPRPFTVR